MCSLVDCNLVKMLLRENKTAKREKKLNAESEDVGTEKDKQTTLKNTKEWLRRNKGDAANGREKKTEEGRVIDHIISNIHRKCIRLLTFETTAPNSRAIPGE
ncbi:hypothetical protein AC249_AIPGENE14861 [Exaiptasia diaphana]|nr:hypothetical protein AC249_AIPGENE14861 [Exaiptasia diaphana]